MPYFPIFFMSPSPLYDPVLHNNLLKKYLFMFLSRILFSFLVKFGLSGCFVTVCSFSHLTPSGSNCRINDV